MRLRTSIIASVIFGLLLYGFWHEAVRTGLVATLGGHIGSAFACFALLLAVLWYFGLGAGEWLGQVLAAKPEKDPTHANRALEWGTRSAIRVLLPAALAIPYVVFAVPRGEFHWVYALGLAVLPVALAALLEFGDLPPNFTWRDGAVLLIIAVVLEVRVFAGAWPYSGLGSMPKLYLADVTLYLYVVVRRLEGIGYSLVPQWNDFTVGLREWVFFLPIALGLGFATHFIHFYPRVPSMGHVIGAVLVIFLLTAIPEELFFRGILQNLLERRIGDGLALVITACLFGLSHFNKGATFNWRYVIIAAIAGIFYGRAWRARRHLFASAITHTLVDVIWGLWFR